LVPQAPSWREMEPWDQRGGDAYRENTESNASLLPCNRTLLRLVLRHRTSLKGTVLIYVQLLIQIRFIEGNAKSRLLQKLTCKETFRQVFICLRHRYRISYPPPPHTVYVYTVYLFTQERWKGRRGEPERRGEKQQLTKLGRKHQLCLQSINSINTCRKSLYRSFFR
jgi:hypothetical protein